MKDLAQRLLAFEAQSPSSSDPEANEAQRVIGKLQVSLVRFAGQDGFTALLKRAVALARDEFPSLNTVRVTADGSMEGLDQVSGNEERDRVTLVITGHLLALLVTFIGESLTLRLVKDAWPHAVLKD